MNDGSDVDNNSEDKERNEGLTCRNFLAGAALATSAITACISHEEKAASTKARSKGDSGRPKP